MSRWVILDQKNDFIRNMATQDEKLFKVKYYSVNTASYFFPRILTLIFFKSGDPYRKKI